MERVKIRLANKLASARTLVLEPWAHEVPLPSGSTYLLVLEGNLATACEVEFSDDRVTVYAFDDAGASLELYDAAGHQLF